MTHTGPDKGGDMKRWLVGIAALGLVVGVAGPVAAKSISARATKPAAATAAPSKAATKPVAATAPVIAPKHHGGGYPGPNLPRVKVDPSSPSRNRTFKVQVEYFCRRSTVSVAIDPAVSGWPVSISTDRYGKGYVKVGGISTRGTNTLTATCGSDTATTTFRIK